MPASPRRRHRDREKVPAFVPSKWETVDQSELEAQGMFPDWPRWSTIDVCNHLYIDISAMTTSKWDELDPPEPKPSHNEDDDLDGKSVIFFTIFMP